MILIYMSTERWSPISATIRWNTRCIYSHCGFFDSVTGQYLSAQLAGGVRWRSPNASGVVKEKFTKVGYLTAPRVEEACAWAEKQIGKSYDRTAIFGIALDRDWHDEDSWFCSELVAASFEAIGAPLFNTKMATYRIVPENLLLSPWVSFAEEMTASMRMIARRKK